MAYLSKTSDLHRRSPRIFLACLATAILVTGFLLTIPLPERRAVKRPPTIPPVVIQLQDIPETRQTRPAPAPLKPFIPSALPIAADNLPPDTFTVPDTRLDLEATPEALPMLPVPSPGGTAPPTAAAEEKEVFEFYSVEEKPKRLSTVVPEYPEIAKRTGIEGTVLLKLLVNREGRVDSVKVQKGPEVFQKAAITAARKTVFSPARQNDRPVACWVVIPFRFVLDRER
jgi:protein TonB